MFKSLSKQLQDIFNSPSPTVPHDNSQPLPQAYAWIDEVNEILYMFPNFYRVNLSVKPQFRISGVYEHMITGDCRFHGREYQIFLDRVHEVPVGCTCETSKGELPCEHGYQFARYLLKQLREPTNLQYRVNHKLLDINPPLHSQFVPNPLDQHKSYLTMALNSLSTLAIPSIEQPLELALDSPAEVGRIVWSFSLRPGEQFAVTPTYQTAKKRGGWTKGKRMALERISEFSDILTSTDRRVCNKIVRNPYSSDWLNPLTAAVELIGATNVLINDRPGSIASGSLTVNFDSSADYCTLRIGGPDTKSALLNEGYVELNEHDNVMAVCRLSSAQSACAKTIRNMPNISAELRSDVIRLARQIQSHLTVNLPDEIAGPQVDDVACPLLLLMLDEKGVLSYGSRVRLSTGRVALPGQGVLTMPETRAGQAIQLVRSASQEIGMWQMLNERLGLPSGTTEGKLTDFEAVLQLLQKVKQLESDQPKLEVLWDQKSQQPIRLLGSVTPENLRVRVQKSRDWLQLNGECDFGDDAKIELPALLRSLRNLDPSSIRGNYVKLGDRGWAKISEALRKHLKRLDDSVNEDRKKLVFDVSSAQIVQDLAKLEIQIDGTAAWTQCMTRIDNARNINPQLPAGLCAQPRDYQREGFCWMRRLAEWGVGGVLADDMGLGKTMQTLAVLLDRSDCGPALVIAPTSVGFNWIREVEKFAPALRAQLYRETDRNDFLSHIGPGSLVVCSYGLALRDVSKLAKTQWGTLVLDEAQAVKNARSKTAMAIAEIKADWKVALTGTPVENHLGELWSIFHAVAPGVLGGWEQFRKRFALPIEKDGDDERRQALRQRIQPFVLRRSKQEVLKDLPARTEMNLYVELSREERQAYDRVRLSAVGELDSIAKLDDIQDQRFKMLALLTRLRQLACSPKLVHGDWPSRSSKLELLLETLHELRQEGHRALIFSQFVTHLQLIRQMLVEEGISFEYLDGSTTPVERQKRVDQFQSGSSDVFLISLKAGGTGLNLTAADYVIHTDPWWNPAVEDQATDRAHRIGQDKPVMVYRLVSKGTIEEEILKLHDSKRDLVAGVLAGSHTSAKLSTKDLIELIRGT